MTFLNETFANLKIFCYFCSEFGMLLHVCYY